MFSVLIADDMVPDRSLTSEENVREHYSSLYPGTEFADGAVFVYKLLNLLRSEGYSVDLANTRADALRLAASESYDVIILDLWWWAEKEIKSDDEKKVLGFQMADEILRANPSEQILMFSSRFFQDAGLAKTAAEKGCLPVFKSYNDVSAKSLLVTIRWVLFRKACAERVLDQVKLISLKTFRQLSTFLLCSIISATVLLFFAVLLALFKKTDASIVASIFGTVATFLNGGIYWLLSGYHRKSIS
jgi:CheY-like chemotaxis protein